MRVIIFVTKENANTVWSDIQQCFSITPLKQDAQNDDHQTLTFGWSEEVFPEAKAMLETYLGTMKDNGWVLDSHFSPTPDEEEDEEDKDEEDEEDRVALAWAALERMSEEWLYNSFDDAADIVCEALQRFIAQETEAEEGEEASHG